MLSLGALEKELGSVRQHTLLTLVTLGLLYGCPQPPADLVAGFRAAPLFGDAPLEVRFTDQSTSNGEAILAYGWAFGDGAQSNARNPLHVYQYPGTYSVSLTVTTENLSDTATRTALVTVTSSEGQAPEPGEVRAFSGIEFVWIPPGSFDMGSRFTAEEVSEAYGDRLFYFVSEHPLHHVAISHGFWMGRYEVTQAQWEAVMDGNPSEFNGGDLPVEQVSWEECQDFIARLNRDFMASRFRE